MTIKDKDVYPVVPMNADGLVRRVGNFFVNRRPSTLRLWNDRIAQNPTLQRELAESGGAEQIITSAEEPITLARSYDFASSMQTGMFISEFTEGVVGAIPSVQELSENIKTIINTTTKIKNHLDECCEDIKGLLQELRKLVLKNHRESLKYYKTLYDESIQNSKDLAELIIGKIDDLRTFFVNMYECEKSEFISSYKDEKDDVIKQIRQIIKDELSTTNKKIIDLQKSIDSSFEDTNKKIHDIDRKLDQNFKDIKEKFDDLEHNISSVETKANTINETLDLYIEGWGTVTEIDVEWKASALLAIAGVAGTITSEIATLTGFIKGKAILNTKGLKKNIKNLTEKVSDQVIKSFEEFQKYTDKEFEDLPEKTGLETSSLVVGQAYSRWDSITSYFPCLVLNFKDFSQTAKKRYSQVKLRLKTLSSDLTEKDILELRYKASLLKGLSYQNGPSRGYYISEDKRFKTTVYANSRGEQINLLQKIFPLIDEPFDSNLLSTTNLIAKRMDPRKRNKSLDTIPANAMDYNSDFGLRLLKVTLLVNGLAKPVEIFYDKAEPYFYRNLDAL